MNGGPINIHAESGGIAAGRDVNIGVRDDELHAKVEALKSILLRNFEATGEAEAARKLGITNERLVALARAVAADVNDPEQAFLELEAAIERYKEYQQEPLIGSNADGALSDLRARLEAFAREGRLRDAQDEANAAFRRWEQDEVDRQARAAQTGIAILNEGIRRDLDVRDATGAAEKLARRVDLETPHPAARFGALRAEQDIWYVRGRDRGLRLDLEVSIALAGIARTRATSADQRGAALNDLAIALTTLGARETGTARLEDAVDAYRAALGECTRDRVPLLWAMTQMNFGNALQTIGRREAWTKRLEEAVAAYRAGLEVMTRDCVPLDWAMTQMNLGNALQAIGERETGTARLEEAVAAYRAALEVRTRNHMPLQWALTQNNLGGALAALGERGFGTARLEEAVAAYRAALEEWTRDRVPLDWAGTQNNLGSALQTLGEREPGTTRLEEAVSAYRAALEERSRDRVPLDWALTQNNLGNALRTLGERETGTARFEEAVEAYRAALEVLTRDRVPLHWATTRYNTANLHLALFDRTGAAAELDLAQATLDDARAVFRAAQASRYLAMAARQQAAIDTRRR